MDPATGMMIASGIGALGNIGSSLIGGNAQERAQKRALTFIRKSQERAEDRLSPYLGAGEYGIEAYENFNQEGGLGRVYLDQMQELAERGLNLDYHSDPAYQWRLQQQEEALNRQMASRGGYDSRDAFNMLGDATMALSGQEADKQYARATDAYNRDYSNLMNLYNLENTHLGNLSTLGMNATNSINNLGMGGAMAMAELSQPNMGMANAFGGLGNGLSDMLSTYTLKGPINNMVNDMSQPEPSLGLPTAAQWQQQPSYNGGFDYSKFSLMGDH